jgi:hypothetical protein
VRSCGSFYRWRVSLSMAVVRPGLPRPGHDCGGPRGIHPRVEFGPEQPSSSRRSWSAALALAQENSGFQISARFAEEKKFTMPQCFDSDAAPTALRALNASGMTDRQSNREWGRAKLRSRHRHALAIAGSGHPATPRPRHLTAVPHLPSTAAITITLAARDT